MAFPAPHPHADAASAPSSFNPHSWVAPLPLEPVAQPRRSGRALAVVLLLAATIGAGHITELDLIRLPPRTPLPPSSPTNFLPSKRPAARGEVRMVVRDLAEFDQILAASDIAPDLRAEIARQVTTEPAYRAGASMRVIVHRNAEGAATALTVRQSDGKSMALSWDRRSKRVRKSAVPSPLQYKVIKGEVDCISFYSSAVAAGMLDRLVPEFAATFAHDIDFQREIAPGDIFQAVYETDEGTQDSRLLYASLTTRHRTINLYRYAPSFGGKAGWFDGNGVGAARSLLRTPVDGARVSSSFGPRFHPVLRYTRLHRGVDFAVPIGTQVYGSGDGIVRIAESVRGYGNYLVIRHADDTETAYAHLSHFASGITPGATVQQGQLVALSGNSGLSSGPHLHYEVYVQGVATDPMQLTQPGSSILPASERSAFRKARDRIDRLRTKGGNLISGSAE